jgi:anti-sigma regulatory factor (Ser/Thr protein kinase)
VRVPTRLPTSARDAPTCFRQVFLPAFPQTLREARQWTSQTLQDWHRTASTHTIEQLVSELLANSIEHARTTSVGVCLISTDRTVLIEVSDSDADRLPARRSPGPDDTSGRGLLIVDELSDRWGVQVTDHGKTVWCEVAVPRADS